MPFQRVPTAPRRLTGRAPNRDSRTLETPERRNDTSLGPRDGPWTTGREKIFGFLAERPLIHPTFHRCKCLGFVTEHLERDSMRANTWLECFTRTEPFANDPSRLPRARKPSNSFRSRYSTDLGLLSFRRNTSKPISRDFSVSRVSISLQSQVNRLVRL